MAGAAVMHIRPMVPADVEAALEIEQETYPEPWSEGVFADELGRDDRIYLAADLDGRLVGYGGLMVIGDEAHVTTLTVAPEARGSRIGTRLMLALARRAREAGARSLTLEVRVSNVAAQALYRRFGMAPVGVRKRYYRDEDALIMWAHDIDTDEYGRRLAEIEESL